MTTDIAGLPDLVGIHLGYTDWQEMSQERVNQFADATDDHQFIHVDPERAKDTPFGGTIAHGFLALSLIASVGQRLLPLRDAKMGINYGLDRVRFPAPLPVGAEWRVGAEISQVDGVKGGRADQDAGHGRGEGLRQAGRRRRVGVPRVRMIATVRLDGLCPGGRRLASGRPSGIARTCRSGSSGAKEER